MTRTEGDPVQQSGVTGTELRVGRTLLGQWGRVKVTRGHGVMGNTVKGNVGRVKVMGDTVKVMGAEFKVMGTWLR